MEIKQIVREMLGAGMPESEIISNLTDLGIPDAPKVLAEAKAAAGQKAVAKPAPKEAPEAQSQLFSDELSAPASASKPSSLFDEKPEPAIPGSILGASSSGSSLLGSDQKLDELMALTRSLLELNRKILDSNREILLRLSK